MDKILELKELIKSEFQKKGMSKNTERLMGLDHVDRRIYAIYMIETYHYTRHNTKNQALVAARRELMPVQYQKFCLNHALEEAGHEYMALHDLNSLGTTFAESDLPEPLQETKALIAYLYEVSSHGNLYARLGYSFWAESSYDYIGKSMGMIQQALGLKDSQMTFFKSHHEIDKKHVQEIEEAILRFAKTQQDYDAVKEVMLTSLRLTGIMMDKVIVSYLERVDNISNRYDFLDVLKEN